jgi:ABC-type sugar transport system ATPase subunit
VKRVHLPAEHDLWAIGPRLRQTPRVFDSLTLAENVVAAGLSVRSSDSGRLLVDLGVGDPHKSGSSATLIEHRLAEIARVMAVSRTWLLLDEPLAGLSMSEHELILGQVADLSRAGVAIVLIEHLIPVIAPVTDRMGSLTGAS